MSKVVEATILTGTLKNIVYPQALWNYTYYKRARSLFFLFHLTTLSHSNAWPGTASNNNKSETTLHQKRMPSADRTYLRQQTVETNCKNEPCYLERGRQGVDYCCFIWSQLHQLSCNSCTKLWHSSLFS
jgi:hypothetical protein